MKLALEYVSRVLLAALFFYFALIHVQAFIDSGKIIFLLVVIVESILVVLYVFRRVSQTISYNFVDWFYAIVGTAAPLFLIPSAVAINESLGSALGIVGVSLSIPSILSLNRSFGIVPANRGIQTKGMYTLVRHPIYATYVFTWSGYLLASYSLYNVGIIAFSVALMVLRILKEEAHLLKSDEYQAYVKRVKWRIVPFVF